MSTRRCGRCGRCSGRRGLRYFRERFVHHLRSLLPPALYPFPSCLMSAPPQFEAVGMFGICLCRAWELRINTEVVRALDSTLANRSVESFKAGLARGAVVWIAGAWLRIIYSYLQARLTWKWR